MGEATALPPPDPKRPYSWWWDSHISPKNSKWLQENLTDITSKVKMMIRLIEEDGADSFARRAEMYYQRRPELMKLVEEFYRAYRALAERYDHATTELRHTHRLIADVCPDLARSPSSSSPPYIPCPLTPDGPQQLGVFFEDSASTYPKAPLSFDDLFLGEDATEDSSGGEIESGNEAEAMILKQEASKLLKEEENSSLKLKDSEELEKVLADIETLVSVQSRYLEEHRALSSEIRGGISVVGEVGVEVRLVRDGVEDLKAAAADSFRNLLEENLNLRKENEKLREKVHTADHERDAVCLLLEGIGKLLECSERRVPAAERLQEITANLVRLLERNSRLEDDHREAEDLRASLDEERRRWVSFVLLGGARLAAAEDELRRLRQMASEAEGRSLKLAEECKRQADVATAVGGLVAELEGECLVRLAEAESLAGEKAGLEAGIREIAGSLGTRFGDGPGGDGSGEEMVGWIRECVQRAEGEMDGLLVENSALSVLVEGLGVGNDGFALEEVEEAESGIWEAEATAFYFDLQVSVVWGLFFEHTVAELAGRCRHFEQEGRSSRAEAEEMAERVRELEEEAEGLRACFLVYVGGMKSMEEDIESLERFSLLGKGVVHPGGSGQGPKAAGQGKENRDSESGGAELGFGRWDIEKMGRGLKRAEAAVGEEMERLRGQDKLSKAKLETSLKVIQDLRAKKPTHGCGPHPVKDILLDPISGLYSDDVLLFQLSGSPGGEGSWTFTANSPGSCSSTHKSRETATTTDSLFLSQKIRALLGPSRRLGFCSCMMPSSSSTRPH